MAVAARTLVLGNAADLGVLTEAGIEETPSVIITTHDDDLNVYLQDDSFTR